VDGTVEAVTETYSNACSEYGCAATWSGNTTVTLSDRKTIKGPMPVSIPSDTGMKVTASAQICGAHLVKVDRALIGQRIRIFGSQSRSAPPGYLYFAFEMVSP
jgi:hypothetical protein